MNVKNKKATVAKIAEASGTSSATVSRVLNHPSMVNEKTLKKIHAAMKELNYPRREPAAKDNASGNLILVITSDPANMFYSDIEKGIRTSAAFHKSHVMFCHDPIDDSTMHYISEQIKRGMVQGLIFCTPTKPEYLELLSESTHIVQCTEFISPDYSYVGINNYEAARAVLNHIYFLGYRKILFVNGPLEYRYARERQDAFVQFAKEVNIPYESPYIVNIPRIDYDMAYVTLTQLLMSENRPDAIFATSDIFAIAASKAAAHFHIKVPDELAIVGFDNISLLSAIATPTITSLSQPRFQMGYNAADILFEAMHSKEPDSKPKHILLGTELIIRESSTLTALQQRSLL